MDFQTIKNLVSTEITTEQSEYIISLIDERLILSSKINTIKELINCVRSNKIEAVKDQQFESAACLRDIEKQIYYQIEKTITKLDNNKLFCQEKTNLEVINKNSKISDFICD